MSYLVLARKYRPQTFEEIVGQEHVTRTLTNAIGQGRLHHAFLFTGARGVGKTTAARILAKALSCDQAPTATPCNVCDACKEITSGSSVDVQEIDAASNNGVDNIRELRESIRYAPVRGKKKVYILDEVHMLSSGAWNALLKTLEEPPPHAIFVFATTDPHKLPATILSRVQRYDFKLVPARRIVEHAAAILAAEKIEYDPAALMLIARESGGSVRDSLSLLDQVIASVGAAGITEVSAAEVLGVADRALLTKLGKAVLAKDAESSLVLVDAAFVRGYDLPQIAHAFLGHLRDLVVTASVKDPAALIEACSAAEIEELRLQVQSVPAGLCELLFDRFAKIAEEVAKSPVPRYVLEVGLVELTRVEPLEPLGGLLAKLESLEGRLEKGGGRAQASSVHPAQDGPSPSAQGRGSAPVQKAAPPAPKGFLELIDAIMSTDPMLCGLAQSRLLGMDDKKFSIGFDKDFAADGVRERLPQLRAALKALTGKELIVEIVVGAMPADSPSAMPGTETVIEVEQRKIDEEREQRRQEALGHPARKLIEEKFGGATWKDPVVDLEKE